MKPHVANVLVKDSLHDSAAVIALFNQCFAESCNTRLIRGDGEPVYLPADADCGYHRVVFAHGFFSSALHEIAHWCVAGEARRQQVDYGYWYCPDGRNADQQREFEQVEVKPQALEWIFSRAAGLRFRVSVDNLNGVETDPTVFREAVYQQVLNNCRHGLNARAEKFRSALADYFSGSPVLSADDFHFSELVKFGS